MMFGVFLQERARPARENRPEARQPARGLTLSKSQDYIPKTRSFEDIDRWCRSGRSRNATTACDVHAEIE
jgi:hypothetical protein